MVTARRPVALGALAVVLAAAVLGSQATAEALAPQPPSGQAAALGKAGFAYVASLRRFAAAVLWNRLEPQFHEYYGSAGLQNMGFVLPNTRVIVALDPQLVEPYYVAPYILFKKGRTAEARALASEGARNNPDSGRLHASYAQILQLSGDLEAAVAEADLAIGAKWNSAAEAHSGMAMVRGVYQAAGLTERIARADAVIARLDAELGDQLPAGEHDHDGDGKPDH